MSERTEKYAQRLASARTRLIDALEKAQPYADAQLYSDGAQWTIRQLAIHVMIADAGVTNIIKQIAIGENPVPADYDVNRYNARSVEKNAGVTIPQALAGMEQSRAHLIAWLSDLDDTVLDKVGRHPLLQDLSLAQFLNVMALHENGHADDVEAFLNAKLT